MKKLSAAFGFLVSCGLTIFAQEKIENSKHSTIGYIPGDGEVKNSKRSTTGCVRSNGTPENIQRRRIGYAKNVKHEHAAAFFFFQPKK